MLKNVFQFTPLREGRRVPPVPIVPIVIFQFTPLREGRHWSAPTGNNGENFNSRPCVRGDLWNLEGGKIDSKFQFTPLREGRLAWAVQMQDAVLFQFTPLREGRLEHSVVTTKSKNFNSRPCVRGDL